MIHGRPTIYDNVECAPLIYRPPTTCGVGACAPLILRMSKAHDPSIHRPQVAQCLKGGRTRVAPSAQSSICRTSRSRSKDLSVGTLHRHRRWHVYCAGADVLAIKMTASARAFQRYAALAQRMLIHMCMHTASSRTVAERRAYQGGAFCAFENLPDLPISVKRFSTTSQMDSYWCRCCYHSRRRHTVACMY